MAASKFGEIQFVSYTEIPHDHYPMTDGRFDPAKDAANREKHKLPLVFGDRIFEDDNSRQRT